MQNIEVSNIAYQKLMKYCNDTGHSASVAILRFIDEADKSENVNLALLEEDCARVMRENKRKIPFEEVFDGI